MSHGSEDVVLCIDRSRSMYRQDYYPSRIEAAKKAATEFIVKKSAIDPNDRFAIVTFSDVARIEQRLTTDIGDLEKKLSKITAGGASRIDSGLGLSLELLSGTIGRTHRVIVISDGRPYGVTQDPLRIALRARSLGAIIDVIGIGNPGSNDFGEPLLKALARLTNGEYAYVTDSHRLVREVIRLTSKKLLPNPNIVRDTTQVASRATQGLVLWNIVSPAKCSYCHETVAGTCAYRCSTCGGIFDEKCVLQMMQVGRCPFCKSTFL